MCQRFSGGPVIFGVTFPKEAVRFTQGEPTYYKSSPIAERGFCKRCGSSLMYKPLARRWTDWMFVFGGSLDNPELHTPVWHLGVESTIPWFVVDDELPRVRCDESPSLVEAWANAAKEPSPLRDSPAAFLPRWLTKTLPQKAAGTDSVSQKGALFAMFPTGPGCDNTRVAPEVLTDCDTARVVPDALTDSPAADGTLVMLVIFETAPLATAATSAVGEASPLLKVIRMPVADSPSPPQ